MAHILLMEDDPDQAYFIEQALTEEGYTVKVTSRGNDAWEYCQQPDRPISLVITDILVKENGVLVTDGGVLLVGRIRRDNRRSIRLLPVVAMTGVARGYPHPDLLQTVKASGANRVFEKPLDLAELKNVVAELTSQ